MNDQVVTALGRGRRKEGAIFVLVTKALNPGRPLLRVTTASTQRKLCVVRYSFLGEELIGAVLSDCSLPRQCLCPARMRSESKTKPLSLI